MYYNIKISKTITKKPIICLEIFFPEKSTRIFESNVSMGLSMFTLVVASLLRHKIAMIYTNWKTGYLYISLLKKKPDYGWNF